MLVVPRESRTEVSFRKARLEATPILVRLLVVGSVLGACGGGGAVTPVADGYRPELIAAASALLHSGRIDVPAVLIREAAPGTVVRLLADVDLTATPTVNLYVDAREAEGPGSVIALPYLPPGWAIGISVRRELAVSPTPLTPTAIEALLTSLARQPSLARAKSETAERLTAFLRSRFRPPCNGTDARKKVARALFISVCSTCESGATLQTFLRSVDDRGRIACVALPRDYRILRDRLAARSSVVVMTFDVSDSGIKPLLARYQLLHGKGELLDEG